MARSQSVLAVPFSAACDAGRRLLAAKPIMVAEWGMYHRVAYPTSKAAAFRTVVPELAQHPKVKAIVYFDTAKDDTGDRNIAVDSTPDSLTAFRQAAASPIFDVDIDN